MVQLVLTLTICGLLAPRAGALAHGTPEPASQQVRAAQTVTEPAGTASHDEPFRITRQTDIRLDGNPCAYEQIPPGAAVTFAEVGPDRRAVLRLHFRSPN
jgi:hypothetical protein